MVGDAEASMEIRVMPEVERVGYVPGIIGRIAEMHGVYYEDYWQMGVQFEAKVAEGLAEFMCRFNSETDGVWIIRAEGRIVGSIVIDGSLAATKGARLRWFIIEPTYQGSGLGKQMFNDAINFCRAKGYRKVYLTTFAGLDAARHLYEKVGFRLTHEEDGDMWGKTVTEQVFELDLTPKSYPVSW
jgi:GNAT superfamily N-acetyltransferase